MQGEGLFYDGETAGRHDVRIALSSDRQSLVIAGDSLPASLHWPLADLRALSDQSDERQIVLTRLMDTDDEAPRDPARLVVTDLELSTLLRNTRPGLFRKDLRAGTGRRIARNLALAAGALAVMLFVILPALSNTMATLIPLKTEIRFGKTVVAQMERFLGGDSLGALRCDAPEGRAALDRMLARLTAGQTLDYDISVLVFDHEMVNAFAAPGGQVVLLRGLLDKAQGPDEVAGVLAHEIAHVVNRDATRNALRAAGSAGLLSMVLGDVTGGTLLVIVADQMLNSAHSRKAESAADAFALDMLDAAGISSTGFGRFFDELIAMERGIAIPEYLASHPDSAGRAASARRHADTQSATTASLDPADWAALRAICTKG